MSQISYVKPVEPGSRIHAETRRTVKPTSQPTSIPTGSVTVIVSYKIYFSALQMAYPDAQTGANLISSSLLSSISVGEFDGYMRFYADWHVNVFGNPAASCLSTAESPVSGLVLGSLNVDVGGHGSNIFPSSVPSSFPTARPSLNNALLKNTPLVIALIFFCALVITALITVLVIQWKFRDKFIAVYQKFAWSKQKLNEMSVEDYVATEESKTVESIAEELSHYDRINPKKQLEIHIENDRHIFDEEGEEVNSGNSSASALPRPARPYVHRNLIDLISGKDQKPLQISLDIFKKLEHAQRREDSVATEAHKIDAVRNRGAINKVVQDLKKMNHVQKIAPKEIIHLQLDDF
jgi:hypothetical protein